MKLQDKKDLLEGKITMPISKIKISNDSIIKVIGVGGGGGNAVNHMFRKGIEDVTFMVCNTDYQDLEVSPVPIKIQIGEEKTNGLGAGGNPEIGFEAAQESIDLIKHHLSDNTKMVFITAGMGGGTGTGASPVVAQVASELNILTIGIVTIPFAFEGKNKIIQALKGIAKLSEHVDALLVINNEKLKDIYSDLGLSNAFEKADDILSNSAKAIAEIITKTGHINIDFADVNSIMRKGKVAIMNTGYAEGDERITNAIEDALNSPLLNTSDVKGATKILLSLYCSKENEIRMDEVKQVHRFMESVGEDINVIWGIAYDETLGEKVKITLIATGFEVSDLPEIIKHNVQSDEIKEALPEDNQTKSSSPKAAEEITEIENKDILVDSEIIEKKPNEDLSDEDISTAFKKLYGTSIAQPSQPKKSVDPIDKSFDDFDEEEEEEEDFPELDLFDLLDEDDDDKLKEIKNIPAWKRIKNDK